MLLTGGIIFSCANNPIDLHVPLKAQDYCIHEKFTEPEKAIIPESAGQRIYRNQKACEYRVDAINDIIREHNEEHR